MHRPLLTVTTLYFLFVVYGSLVPLNYHPMPLAEAWARFQQIPTLNLAIESRADWVANILLYIPLAFFATAATNTIGNPLLRAGTAVCVLLGCLITAVAVEFAQLYFPPRTVSINDLVAETLGIGLGFLGWQAFGQQSLRLFRQLASATRLSAQAGIVFFLAVYSFLNLFPFDFVTSSTELADKLDSGSVGFFIAESSNASAFRLVLKLLAEIAVLMPLGALISLLPHIRAPLLLAGLGGFLLGILFESLQLLIFSAVSQGVSVLTRTVGMGLGVIAYQWLRKQKLADWRGRFSKIALGAAAPYAVLVMASNGGFSGTWLTAEAAAAKLPETQFLPFYYFYYTTETIALTSLITGFFAYFPVGFLVWLGYLAAPGSKKPHWLAVGFMATAFALVIETGKLFLAEKHADPTDVLIAFTAAAAGYAALQRLQQAVQTAGNNEHLALSPLDLSQTRPLNHQHDALGKSQAVSYKTHPKAIWASAALLALTAVHLSGYPSIGFGLGLFLAVYAALLWRYPPSWLLVLPALLPVLDFTPYTGRFFFDEFDMLVLVTLAMGYCRSPSRLYPQHPRLFKKRIWLVLLLFGASYLISLLLGLLPLAPLDANAFNHYYSHYNALRVGKGVIWAFLLLPLLRQHLQQTPQAVPLFSYGVLLGLTAMSGFALVERWVFPGLSNFSFDYRINALFSSMHTGGGHIESYLSLSLPFIATLFFNTRHFAAKSLLAVAVFAASLYTLLMTFSRGGYIGLSIGLAVLVFALWASYRTVLFKARPAYLAALPLLVLMPILAIPVFQGDTIKQRFNTVERDKNTRTAHWQNALSMMDHGLASTVFGMGLGSFPRTFFWFNNQGAKPATYLIENEANNPYLRLRGGDALYFGQYLNLKPHTAYRLSLDLRSARVHQPLLVALCEKSLQYAFRCQNAHQNSHGPEWHTVQQIINSGELAAPSPSIAGGWLSRPVQLALQNHSGAGNIIDVDNITLLDSEGNNLIKNGDFNRATDHWFFATEQHNPWHIFNLWVDVLFQTGWLGLFSFSLLVSATFAKLASHLTGNPFAAVLLSSLSSFFVVGFVDSPFDAPRLTVLFFLLVFMGLESARYPQDNAIERAIPKKT